MVHIHDAEIFVVLVPLAFFAMITIISVALIVTRYRRSMHQIEMELAFKEEMLQQGLTVSEIVRLIEAGRSTTDVDKLKQVVAERTASPAPAASPHEARGPAPAASPHEARGPAPAEKEAVVPPRLVRTEDDSMIGGVCGGFAHYLAVDPTMARIATFIAMVMTGIFPLLIGYFVALCIMPIGTIRDARPRGSRPELVTS